MGSEYEPCTAIYNEWLAAYKQWETVYNEATALLLDCDRDFNDMLDSCIDAVENPLKLISCAKRMATVSACLSRAAAMAAKVREAKEAADARAGELWSCINAHTNSRAILPPQPDETEEVDEPAMEFPPMDLTQ